MSISLGTTTDNITIAHEGTPHETRFYEVKKWSVFYVENYDSIHLSKNEGNRCFHEVKYASINLDEMNAEWENGCVLKPCDQKTNEQFGGGQWYEWRGWCLDDLWDIYKTIEFSDKETEKKYNSLVNSDEEKYWGLDPDEVFAELGGFIETVMYLRLERSDTWRDDYKYDITKDFEKYFSEYQEGDRP